MQFQIQRPNLIPEPIDFLREGIRRHVVFRSPHGAVVGETEFSGAFIGQLDKSSIVFAHRRRDRAPAFPDLSKLFFIARVAHDVRDLVDVETGLGLLRVRAPLAFAILRIEICCDPGEFFALFRIRRRRHHEGNLQELQLAPQVGRSLNLVEPHRIFRKTFGGLDDPLVGPRIQRGGVIRNIGFGNPACLGSLDVQLEQAFVHFVYEFLRVGCICCSVAVSAAARRAGRHAENQNQGNEKMGFHKSQEYISY